MSEPATEKYTEADHEADTIPSGVQNVPPVPDPPVAIQSAANDVRRPRLALWAILAAVGTLLLALCIATTVSFLVDLASYGDGGALYALSVVASAATLGAVVTAMGFAVRRMR